MRKFLLCLALAGCVSGVPGTPVPQAARLSAQVLTLTLSDGTICRANWVQAPVGRMDTCGPGYGYAVRVIDNPNILRQIWTELTTALGADGAVAPLAEVVIEGPAGTRRVFSSPPPVEMGD
ncbi:MAG: hypothetical protein Q7J44_03240 [Pseudotabrizicola sp.]|uniref:hypothetical protein n=1 Tax=Pseudotabrizicola sp. TaxID=2939647 RepID=UPI00271C3BF6|nr:hypothetical protein [Pseudotabrizicola sp.]MDO9637537.1 hypothetical protein [Pseudotabrizicola sp.]